MFDTRFNCSLLALFVSVAPPNAPTPQERAPVRSAVEADIPRLLQTGHYADVLRATSAASDGVHDFFRDQQVLETRVQALLAQGRYRLALQCVDLWLAHYGDDGEVGGRFQGDVASARFLQRHLKTLVRNLGASGPSIHTSKTEDPARGWNKQTVPIRVVRLLPLPTGQLHEALTSQISDQEFTSVIDEINRGFAYLSQRQFALQPNGFETVYLKEGDLDPQAMGGRPLASRVFVQSLPDLATHSAEGFTILVDFRAQALGESRYLGDGFIHVAAANAQAMILMHEILHGLGASHQEIASLEGPGRSMDPTDRGLMTFDQGQLNDLGLEQKNRRQLGWDPVAVIHFKTATAPDEAPLRRNGTLASVL